MQSHRQASASAVHSMFVGHVCCCTHCREKGNSSIGDSISDISAIWDITKLEMYSMSYTARFWQWLLPEAKRFQTQNQQYHSNSTTNLAQTDSHAAHVMLVQMCLILFLLMQLLTLLIMCTPASQPRMGSSVSSYTTHHSLALQIVWRCV